MRVQTETCRYLQSVFTLKRRQFTCMTSFRHRRVVAMRVTKDQKCFVLLIIGIGSYKKASQREDSSSKSDELNYREAVIFL